MVYRWWRCREPPHPDSAVRSECSLPTSFCGGKVDRLRLAQQSGPTLREETLMIQTRVVLGLAATLAVGAGIAQAQGSPYEAPKPRKTTAAAKEDGQWTMPGKDYGSTRFSGLNQITATNAKGLKP